VGLVPKGSVCLVETNGYQHAGLTYTGGYGYGFGLGASTGPSIEISNANQLSDLGGPFVTAGGGYGAAEGEFAVSPDEACGGGHTWTASGGIGPQTPNGHVGATNTGTVPLW